MIYEWKCGHCGKLVDVTRDIADREIPPTQEEAAPFAGITIGGEHEAWVRVYSSSTPFEHLRDQGQFERIG